MSKVEKKGMKRAFVSLPDGVWKILRKDFNHNIGTGDSEVIRNIVISYLSDHGYFINLKGESNVQDIMGNMDTLGNVVQALGEILEEKNVITQSEWETQIRKKLAVAADR
jgi:ABC-type uncharacterized transport system fused permease/ATPase subunit